MYHQYYLKNNIYIKEVHELIQKNNIQELKQILKKMSPYGLLLKCFRCCRDYYGNDIPNTEVVKYLGKNKQYSLLLKILIKCDSYKETVPYIKLLDYKHQDLYLRLQQNSLPSEIIYKIMDFMGH